MKRATRFLIHLYPKQWRRRYADEFDALLDQVPPTLRGFFDVLTGALKMQLTTWSFTRTIAAFSLAGLLTAILATRLVPDRYESVAVIRMTGVDASRRVSEIQAEVLSTPTLANIIWKYNLYPAERNPSRWAMDVDAQTPLREVVERMRRDAVINLIAGVDGTQPAFSIGFSYPDRFTAQRVTQELTAQFIDDNVRGSSSPPTGGVLLELLDPASLPFHPMGLSFWSRSGLGLFLGAMLGTVFLMVIWIRRRRDAVRCPTCGHAVRASRRIAGGLADRP